MRLLWRLFLFYVTGHEEAACGTEVLDYVGSWRHAGVVGTNRSQHCRVKHKDNVAIIVVNKGACVITRAFAEDMCDGDGLTAMDAQFEPLCRLDRFRCNQQSPFVTRDLRNLCSSVPPLSIVSVSSNRQRRPQAH